MPDVPSREEFEALQREVAELREQLKIIDSLQQSMLDTNAAVAFTGVCSKTLVKLAKDENSPVVMKKYGRKNLFDRKSLIAFNKQQPMRKRVDPERVRDQFLYPDKRNG